MAFQNTYKYVFTLLVKFLILMLKYYLSFLGNQDELFSFSGVWFVSFQPFPAFVIGSTILCLFIHKTIINMKKIIQISLLLMFLSVGGCSTTEPPIPPDEIKPTLTLELDDASCVEAWLQLKTKDLTLPAELTLKQFNPNGDSVTQTFSLSTKDSLLYIDSLLPNQNYSFQVSSIQSATGEQVSSIKQPVTTMDTTSHNFSFQSWTFGTVGSSVLYDVAIINENNIWAVGEIMIADTSQNGYTVYNAVHWDGNDWSLHKLYFYTIPGQQDTGVYEARSILAFDENNIWITSGSQITKWDGIRQTNRHSSPVYVNKLWGTDNNNIYAVGYNGQIARFNGTNWQRIESGTTLNINDIWGDFNEKTQEWEILAVASNKFFNDGSKILKIENATVVELNKTGLPWSISSIWSSSGKKYYIGGDGLFTLNKINQDWIKVENFPPFYKDIIRGTSLNNLFVGGSNGLLSHFNGYSWKHYLGSEIPYFTGRFLAGAINNNIIVATGWKEQKSIVIIGKK